MKKRYDTVKEKLWNLETRMDTMSKYQAENFFAIQSKLNALLRNFIAQDKSVDFRMDCPLFWEAVKDQGHPKHKLALAVVQNPRNRQAENYLQNKEAASGDLSTNTVKAVTQVRDAGGARQGVHLR